MHAKAIFALRATMANEKEMKSSLPNMEVPWFSPIVSSVVLQVFDVRDRYDRVLVERFYNEVLLGPPPPSPFPSSVCFSCISHA